MGALLLSLLLVALNTEKVLSVSSPLHECVIKENITQFPDNSSVCCNNKNQNNHQYLLRLETEEETTYMCVDEIFCDSNNVTGGRSIVRVFPVTELVVSLVWWSVSRRV